MCVCVIVCVGGRGGRDEERKWSSDSINSGILFTFGGNGPWPLAYL